MIDEHSPDIRPKNDDPVFVERRRPGRREYLSPELIQLLRRDSCCRDPVLIEDDASGHDEDQLRAPMGIMIGLVPSLLTWMMTAVTFRYMVWL